MNINVNEDNISKQFGKNVMMNALSFIIGILIGLLLVPYFIEKLGVAAYGIIPIATSVSTYIGIFTQTTNASVSRYLTLDLQKKDFKKANITFNTSLFGIIAIVLTLTPLIFILSYFSPKYINVPSNQETDVVILFFSVLGSFIIGTVGGLLQVSPFAYNRIDIIKGINIISTLTQVVLVVIFFILFTPSLMYVGLSYLISSIISFLISIYIFRSVSPSLKISSSYFDKRKLKEMFSTTGWMMINHIGGLLFLQTDIILVNILFGATSSGEYAVVLKWSTLIRTMTTLLTGILTPIYFTYFAKKQLKKIIATSSASIKLIGLSLALPIGCICGFSSNLLSLWVGEQFIKLAPLMWISLTHLIINLPVYSLSSINICFNKVRIPGIITILTGLGSILLSITLSHYTNLGYYSVAIAGATMLTLNNGFFISWYTAKLLGIKKSTFIFLLTPGIFAMLIIGVTAHVISQYIYFPSIISLIVCCIMLSLLYLFLIWLIALNQKEKELISSLLFQYIPTNRMKKVTRD
ncbi:hypothetical protein MSSIT_3774 [Methanosarcina siciliae T4/M]|uniref:Polysaccharide biosynthesis protein n=1 Tax=Methanosarcina siciliae T4/M TaxID=1434120 RepID=A0A0E3P912_9EURY|nr:oligosaccharide flippase family protein [Methanosarcina siciliae]AKB30493.1 hypothetical protein MSSIT_3774 [Methanosarcina siciliae T4/M]